eukprot:COSAG04_NODE_2360_length_4275_cov_2.918822_2_plen_119_part_00
MRRIWDEEHLDNERVLLCEFMAEFVTAEEDESEEESEDALLNDLRERWSELDECEECGERPATGPPPPPGEVWMCRNCQDETSASESDDDGKLRAKRRRVVGDTASEEEEQGSDGLGQ